MNELLPGVQRVLQGRRPDRAVDDGGRRNAPSDQSRWWRWIFAGGGLDRGQRRDAQQQRLALELPLTGMTTVGSDYAGSHSGWTLAPAGKSTYTALTAWPAPPTVPVIVTVPTGPAPTLGSGPADAQAAAGFAARPQGC